MSATEYKFSARRENLALDGTVIGHPRSRWRGCPYWLSSSPDAISSKNGDTLELKELSPKKLASVVKPTQEAVDNQATISVELGDPFRSQLGFWLKRIHPRGPVLRGSKLSLAINAYFADWIERVHGGRGRWELAPRTGALAYLIGKQVVAVVMGFRLDESDVA